MKGRKTVFENEKLTFQEIEKSTSAALVCDGTQIHNANKAAVKLLESESVDQLVNANFLDLSSPIQANGKISEELFTCRQKDACEKGIVNFEWIVKTAKGRLRPIGITLIPLEFSGDKMFCIYMNDSALVNDIEAKEAQEYPFDRFIFNIQDIAVVGYDKNRKITYWNKTSEKNYGYTKEEAVGKYLEDLIIPDQTKADFISAVVNFYESNISIPSAEIILKSKAGLPVYAFASYAMLKNREGENEVYCINFDISGRKRAEKLQNVLQTITHAVNSSKNLEKLIQLVKREIGSVIDATHFYISLYNSESETIEVPYVRTSKVKFEFVPFGITLSSYVLKTQRPLLAKSRRLLQLLKSGEIKMLEPGLKVWLGIPLKVKQKLIGVLAIQSFTDENAYSKDDLKFLKVISHEVSVAIERIKMDNEIKAALEKAKESDRLKSAFLANMSHEIRTPMNGILGFLELLKKPNITKENIQRYTQIMDQSGQRLLETINDILDISRIEAGQVKSDLKEMNVNKILDELFAFFEEQTSSKNVNLKLHKGIPGSDFIIISDQVKIESILTNLIKNAIKFTDSGKIEMGYRIENCELVFFVIDTGVGIEEESLSLIFNRFEQIAGNIKKVQQGSGLGLAISKSYVDMLKGKMWVNSKVKHGSEFYFTIPLQLPKNRMTNGADYSEKGYVQPNVLVVENDPEITLSLQEILDGFAKTVIHVKTGLEAVAKCQYCQAIDVVLISADLPCVDGYQTAGLIREFNTSIIVLAMIDDAKEGEQDKALNSGCDGFITKPIKSVEVLESIGVFFKNKTTE
ncbi:ATP-binding protein [Labilibaculum antarcticum]|uniref:histidine kinase n=1 Tax=Labilibaculum antarcticum TaxID=1717717 RepID=A0A1Y1CNF1_9BACT|nr:ATP-binding protein [Labilibaculum antarcticum]BAX81946.1 hypothetical protein ALGA_3654 [Labilibaculum antarcticum]